MLKGMASANAARNNKNAVLCRRTFTSETSWTSGMISST
jgi:hypothetical protein